MTVTVDGLRATGVIVDQKLQPNHRPDDYPIIVYAMDRFMSGWGEARDGRSFMVMCCVDEEEARLVTAAFKNREEMNPPRRVAHLGELTTCRGDHVSIRDNITTPAWYQPGAFA